MKKAWWLMPAIGVTVGVPALAQSELSLYGTLDTGVLSSQLPNLRANEQLTGGLSAQFLGRQRQRRPRGRSEGPVSAGVGLQSVQRGVWAVSALHLVLQPPGQHRAQF